MAKPIPMPKLSDEMTEGKIAEWLKREGDQIEAGEIVAQVETDKATLDVEAVEGGVLLAIVVGKGMAAPVGSPIAWIGQRGESAPDARGRTAERIIASPAARRVARERGLALGSLAGSGPGGRIVLADLERAPPARAEAPAAPTPPNSEPPLPRRALRQESVPLSPMRRAIARNLAAVKPGAPHFYLEISADMRRAVALREQLNELGQGEVTLNDLVVKAVADTLSRHPEVNASWTGESIVHHAGVHVGVAVAVEEGLITPVLRDADRRSIFDLARAAKELAKRARERRLTPDEYQGGSFTVSNLGMFGIEAFYAIINPPEAAILSVGRVQKVPWVDEQTQQLTVMERCRFGLSGDHRVIDGATGARFLQTFKAVIETPVRLVVPPAP